LYFYHGENHTDPATATYYSEFTRGWTGLGLAVWDADGGQPFALNKIDQVVGLNCPNAWVDAGLLPDAGTGTGQEHPSSGEANALYDPLDGNVYLYFNDRSADPAIADPPFDCGCAWQAAFKTCAAVARAPLAEVCANAVRGAHTQWFKYYDGGFSAPAVAADGTGGPFTPVFQGEGGGPLTPFVYLDQGAFLLVYAVGHELVQATSSNDGVHFDAGVTTLAVADAGGLPAFASMFYPYLFAAGEGAEAGLWLTFSAESPDAGLNEWLEQVPIAVGTP
jgi:hypothetical protein